MKKKHFTLIEIMIVLIVIGLVVTFAIPTYNNALEKAKATACSNNLDTILGALNTYGLENDELPATLGQLKQEHLDKAWANNMQKKGAWKIKLAYFIVDLNSNGLAHAQTFVEKFFQNSRDLTCPADLTPPPEGYSYGLNAALAGMSYTDFKALPAETIVVADSDAATFPPLVERHKKYKLFSIQTYSQEIQKDGEINKNDGDDDDHHHHLYDHHHHHDHDD